MPTKMPTFKVVFEYDEPTRKWEVLVEGATSATEALRGFNAVILTTRDAIPKLECNKAELQKDGRHLISIGQIPPTAIRKALT